MSDNMESRKESHLKEYNTFVLNTLERFLIWEKDNGIISSDAELRNRVAVKTFNRLLNQKKKMEDYAHLSTGEYLTYFLPVGKDETEKRKTLENGEILIRTDEGIFFLANREDGLPLLISEEEGKNLWGKRSLLDKGRNL